MIQNIKLHPNKIKANGTIGIICPSYKISKDSKAILIMEEMLQNMGYKIKYGNTFYEEYSYLAGKDEVRIKDIENMFVDPEVEIIICMLGGYGASRIVDKIDYEIIKKHPKLFMGFSDITVLLNAFNQKANLPTYHGVLGLYIGSPKFVGSSKEDFLQLLCKKQQNRVLKNPENAAMTLIPGVVTGEMVGGNLTLIHNLIGTEYDIDFKDKIIFIEEVDEEPFKIDRYFSALRLSKKLEEAKGFVFGYFTNCEPSKGKEGTWTYLDVIKDYIMHLEKPTIAHFASGHDLPFINIPIGLRVRLDANEQTITILDEFYEEEK